ncbi:MAG: hypothetical protein ACKVIG_14335 [Flavobacteriales bacterium]
MEEKFSLKNISTLNKLSETYYKSLLDINSTINSIPTLDEETMIDLNRELLFIPDFSQINIHSKYYSFLISSCLDLISSLKGILNSKNKWDTIYFSKTGYLVIYELVKTNNYYNGVIFNIINNNSELLEQHKLINYNLKILKKDFNYKEFISKIRNKTSAHFDKDFSVFFELIQDLDTKKSEKALIAFLQVLIEMLKFHVKISSKIVLNYNQEIKKTTTNLNNLIVEKKNNL